jgi:hypothetical protein
LTGLAQLLGWIGETRKSESVDTMSRGLALNDYEKSVILRLHAKKVLASVIARQVKRSMPCVVGFLKREGKVPLRRAYRRRSVPPATTTSSFNPDINAAVEWIIELDERTNALMEENRRLRAEVERLTPRKPMPRHQPLPDISGTPSVREVFRIARELGVSVRKLGSKDWCFEYRGMKPATMSSHGRHDGSDVVISLLRKVKSLRAGRVGRHT